MITFNKLKEKFNNNQITLDRMLELVFDKAYKKGYDDGYDDGVIDGYDGRPINAAECNEGRERTYFKTYSNR